MFGNGSADPFGSARNDRYFAGQFLCAHEVGSLNF
jgi:hypothetical protein